MKSAYDSRLARVRQRMDDEGVGAFLVSHRPNVLYLCGFSGSAGLLLVEPGEATFYSDGRYETQAHQEVKGARVRILRSGLLSPAAKKLASRGRTRAAFEGSHLSESQARRLRLLSGPRVQWRAVEDWVEDLRSTKTSEEIAVMREAARLASRVLQETLPFLRPGVRECDVAAEIEYRMRKADGEPAFATIVASGDRSALPHARASSKRLRKNELVVLDMGVILRHYCSDLTRTVFLGRAPARTRRWYRAVLEAQTAAREVLREGTPAGAADRAARRVLCRFGLERHFTHSAGHGLGLEVHEAPRLARGVRTPLQAGNVVTIEPGVYVPGAGGIRIEDDIALHEDGVEVLTSVTREFLQL